VGKLCGAAGRRSPKQKIGANSVPRSWSTIRLGAVESTCHENATEALSNSIGYVSNFRDLSKSPTSWRHDRDDDSEQLSFSARQSTFMRLLGRSDTLDVLVSIRIRHRQNLTNHQLRPRSAIGPDTDSAVGRQRVCQRLVALPSPHMMRPWPGSRGRLHSLGGSRAIVGRGRRQSGRL
jgi:hypothetical protein